MKEMEEIAISPVIGVMLMLVVTIIIAALVSSFSGSVTSDQTQPPQLTLSVTPVIEEICDTDKTNEDPNYRGGFKANNGITFRHRGGDLFSLKDIAVQLKSRDASITIGYDTVFDPSEDFHCADADLLLSKNETHSRYFGLVGGGSDDMIMPGDTFILVADGCYDNSETDKVEKGKFITWTPGGASGTFRAKVNSLIEYKVIDRISGKAIQTGSFVLR